MLLLWYGDEFDVKESGDGLTLTCRACGWVAHFTPYAAEMAVDREILLHRRLHLFTGRRGAPPEATRQKGGESCVS